MSASVCEGERVQTSVHCHCLQHFSLVRFHLGGGGMLFLFGCILCWGWEVLKYRRNVFFFPSSFNAVIDVASLFCCCSCFCKLIRPHAHAVEILCGPHLMMNVYDFFFTLFFFKHTHEAECLIPSSIFLSFIPKNHHGNEKKKKKKSPLWHVAHPSPAPLPPHEVHWRCTTHNEGSLHASMKLNLRCEWMTEKSCRLWFILMKLYFKTALATEHA